jgi:hypothetical protein
VTRTRLLGAISQRRLPFACTAIESNIGLEVFMTIGRSGWVVLGIFLVGFWLLMQGGQSGDVVVRAVIWGAILLAVGYEAVNLFRRTGHHSTDMTAGLPATWRRWILGESDKS